MRLLAVLGMSFALAGCHAGVGHRWQMTAGTPTGGNPPAPSAGIGVAIPSDGFLGALLIGVLVADGVRYYLRMPDGTPVPYDGGRGAAPHRRINEQDCTRPIDIAAGNLVCR